ncbi:MAG: hypothetical protein A2252_06105 [Elusimicrobia bacterium RIFOXYA2_FULL_39_19]|nr:MAG: hypothetical protein A2252_06105 [Elusimicrobia bacterium RIFOXYA2_FULL_39_19]
MKALQIIKPKIFKIVEVSKPKPKKGEVLIKLEYTAICNQNDYKIFYGLYGNLFKYPCAPGVYGHEGVGTVVEKGSAVKLLKIRDRVVMTIEGGPMLYMEYVTRKAAGVVKISKNVPAQEAAVLELFSCARHCVKLLGDLKDKKIAVIGLGPAGLAICRLLSLQKTGGLTGIEIDEKRIRNANKMGIKRVLKPAALKNDKFSVVIDTTGSPEAMKYSFELAQKEVMFFGFTDKKFEVNPAQWFEKELVIRNSRRQSLSDLKEVVKLAEQGKLKVKDFVSGVFSFEDYDKAVALVYKKSAVKVLLRW